MSNSTLDALRRRLEKWELQHLRALAAELSERLDRAEDEARRAWESSEFWQRNATDMQLELMEADYTVGLTKDGQIVVAKNGGPEPRQGDQPTFILCGPQAVGKTRAAAQIAAGLGCAQIIDDWNGTSTLPAGALAITNGDYVIPPGGIALQVEDCAGMTNLLTLLSGAHPNTEPPDRPEGLAKWQSDFAEMQRVLAAVVNAPRSFASPQQQARHQVRDWLTDLPKQGNPSVDWKQIAAAGDHLPVSPHQPVPQELKQQVRELLRATQAALRAFV